jgi:hypothetical protein
MAQQSRTKNLAKIVLIVLAVLTGLVPTIILAVDRKPAGTIVPLMPFIWIIQLAILNQLWPGKIWVSGRNSHGPRRWFANGVDTLVWLGLVFLVATILNGITDWFGWWLAPFPVFGVSRTILRDPVALHRRLGSASLSLADELALESKGEVTEVPFSAAQLSYLSSKLESSQWPGIWDTELELASGVAMLSSGIAFLSAQYDAEAGSYYYRLRIPGKSFSISRDLYLDLGGYDHEVSDSRAISQSDEQVNVSVLYLKHSGELLEVHDSDGILKYRSPPYADVIQNETE